MRQLYCFLLVAAITNTTCAHAQIKPAYSIAIEASLLKGETDKSNAEFVSQGIEYKNMMAGLAIGVDNYLYRSIPVFVDVRKSFGTHRLQPFVSASAGINISHPTSQQKMLYSWYDNAHFKNGFIGKLSAGFSVRLYKQLRVYGSCGYSYKTTRITYNSYDYTPEQTQNISTDIYRMNRLSFAIGLWY